MNIIDTFKEYFIVIFSIILAVICLFLSFLDPIYLITGYVGFGIAIVWIIYVKGLLGIHIPNELSDEEKDDTQYYYSVDKWSRIDRKKYQLFIKLVMMIIIFWIVFSVILNGLGQMKNFYTENIESTLNSITLISWYGLAIIISVLYLSIIIAFLLRRMPKELKKLFNGFSNRLILFIGILVFGIASIWGIYNDISTESLLIGLVLLPIALIISRVEGKFFYLFSIDQWYQVRNWSILKGKKVRNSNESNWNQIKGFISQIQAFITLLILPVSLISAILVSIDFITGKFASEEVGLLESLVDSLLLTEYSNIILILLTLGPLLALISRPFAFTEVWLNQSLYNKISSPWDLDTLNDNMKQHKTVFGLPQKSKGFRWSLFLSGTGILTLLSINISVSLSTLEEEFIVFITESLLIINFVTSIIFFITLIELNWDLIEEKTLWLFGRVSKEANMDVINYSLYGEYLLYKNQNMDNYLDNNPDQWGLPWFLKGLNLSYSDDERSLAFQSALDENKVLLKSVAPLAWNDYGVLLQRKGNLEEAEQAFIKALALLGEKTEKKDEKIILEQPKVEFIENIDAFSALTQSKTIPESEYIEQSEPISQTMDFIAQSAPIAQTSDGPSSSSRSKESTLLSYDEIIAMNDDESIRSRLESRYSRRGRTKASMNLEAIRRRQESQLPILQEIRDLNKELQDNSENAEKWEKLGDMCLKADFDDKAIDAFKKAAELFLKQSKEVEYQKLKEKLEEIDN